MRTESFLFPRSALAASPRISLFCATQHPWWAIPNAAEIAPSNIVHLAPLTSCRPEYFSLPLAATPVPPSPVRANGGSGRSWKWEPAHVWAPFAGPLPFDIGESTLQLHVTNARITGVTRTDSSRPSRARAPDFASPTSTTPSRGSRCRQLLDAVEQARSSASKNTYLGDSFSRQTLKNRWIRRSGLRDEDVAFPRVTSFSTLKPAGDLDISTGENLSGALLGGSCSASKLLLEIIDGACISFVSLVSPIFLSRSFFFNTCLSIANHMYFKAVVYFKERDGENSIERDSLSPYRIITTFNICQCDVYFRFYYIFNNEKSISLDISSDFFKNVISKMSFII